MEPQSMPSSIPWGTIVLVLVIVVVIALAVAFALWWRRRRRSAPARADSGASLAAKLAHIYKPFYRQIPLSAHHYPTVVVLGEAGAGKSQLIDSHVDWRGQANQFHPSRTDQSLLQLYLGPGIVVQELSAPLLRNVSRDAENALSRLWRRQSRRPAIVVVVMDAHTLATAPPQGLSEFAQLVRGKLDVISDYGRRPVRIRLCLSHLDRIEGYPEFARLLRRRGHQFRLDTVPGQDAGAGLDTALDPFDGHLALALTTCTPDEFRHIVGFYRKSPALFGALMPFLHSLRGGDDPFAVEYSVDGMFLSAANPDDHVGDPFAVDRTTVADDIARENRLRYAICGAILGTALVALLLLFGWHGSRVGDAEHLVDGFAATTGDKNATPQVVAAARERAAHGLRRLDDSEVLWLSSAFEPRKKALRDRYAGAIRDAYLLPTIKTSSDRGQLLYTASLIYAANSSPLGAFIKANPSPWVDELGVPAQVIRDYIRNSPAVWSGSLNLPDDLELSGRAVPRGWVEFLTELERLLQRDRIVPTQLDRLKKEVNDTLALSSAERYQSLSKVAELVARLMVENPTLRPDLAPLLQVQPASEWVRENYDSLQAVSSLIKDASFAGVQSDLTDWTLQTLVTELGTIAAVPEAPAGHAAAGSAKSAQSADPGAAPAADASPPAAGAGSTDSAGSASSASSQAAAGTGSEAAKAKEAAPVYSFALPERTVDIAENDWNRLITRSRAGLLVDRFMKEMDRTTADGGPRSPFFSSRAFYPSAGSVRGTIQGPSVVIPGLYTRRAFGENVLPVLAAMNENLANLLLAERDRTTLKTFTLDSINQYAGEYGQELDNYYRSFGFSPLSLDELIFELQAMGMTSSWFVSFLRTVADNASLDMPAEGIFYEPMANSVAAFQPIVAIMAEDKGKYPQLDPYLTILRDLAVALSATPGGGGDEQEGLELNPAGELAMQALDGKDKPLPQARAWLTTSAVEPAYQYPFLAPIERAYQLGYIDIENAVADAWQNQILDPLQPLLDSFPFNRKAAKEAAIADVEEWFTPEKGRFWQEFATYIEPVAVKRKGQWRMRSPIRAPRGMLTMINRAAAMTAALWDEKGNPQPVPVRLTPQPLPTTQVEGRVATLGFIKAGTAAVYGFNQKPQAQTLALEWFAQGTSSVGMQLRAPEKNGSELRSLDVVDSAWSFYRLLGKARKSRTAMTCWDVPVTTRPRLKTLPVTFILGSDPWDVFDLEK